MQPQIITVHDIHAAIEDVGIVPYANTLVQEMGGGYFFVDAEIITKTMALAERVGHDDWTVTVFPAKDGDSETVYWRYKVHKLPQKIAYFIIRTLQMKSRMAQLDIGVHTDSHEGSMAVYLTPGTEIFGQKIEKLTEIEAELRPVHVERL